MNKKIWNKEAIFKDASRYETKVEWRASSPSAYVICWRNQWLDAACSHMTIVKHPNGYWTPARIKAEAKKYKTTAEWDRLNPASYSVAKKNRLVPKNMLRAQIRRQRKKP